MKNLPITKSNLYFKTSQKNFKKLSNYLFTNQPPMSRTDKIGLAITVTAFVIILSPLALSDSDPYRIKWLIDEVKGNTPLFDNTESQKGEQFTMIVHLKMSEQEHLDATEKIIFGEYRSLSR